MSAIGWLAVIVCRRKTAHIFYMKLAFLVLTAVVGVAACGTGERPFRMVQFCLAKSDDIGAMKTVLREVAARNGLHFFDNSNRTEADLTAMAERRKGAPVWHPVVNIGTDGPTASGFSAANFMEAPLQIVVGFSKDRNAIAARKLSDAVVQALSKRWRVREVPNVETSGAFPLKNCNG